MSGHLSSSFLCCLRVNFILSGTMIGSDSTVLTNARHVTTSPYDLCRLRRLLEAVANKYITYTSNTINQNHGNPFLAVWGFPDDSVVKNLPAVQEMQALYWGGEDTWRRKWQPLQCSCLGSPMDRGSLAGYSLWGHKESDMT